MKLASYFPLCEASEALDAEARLRNVLESVKLKTHPSFHLFGAIDQLNALKRHRQAYELIIYFDDLFPSDSTISFCLAYQNYVNSCFTQGDLIVKGLASQPDPLPLFALEAEGCFRRADFDRCDALFQKASVSRMPLGSYIYWIQALLFLKRFQDALSIVSQALTFFPEEKEIEALWMECLIETNQPESAYQLLIDTDCTTPPLTFTLMIKLASQLIVSSCDASPKNLLQLIDGWMVSVSPKLSSYDQNKLMHVRMSLLDSSSSSSSDFDLSALFAETTQVLTIDAQGMDFISVFILCCGLQLYSPPCSISLLVISDYSHLLADLFIGIAFSSSFQIGECLTGESDLYAGFDLLPALSIDDKLLIYSQDLFLQLLRLHQYDHSANNVESDSLSFVGLCCCSEPAGFSRESLIKQAKESQLIPDHAKVSFTDYTSQFDPFVYLDAPGMKPVQSKYALLNDLQALFSSDLLITTSETLALLACFLNKKICLATQYSRSQHFMLNWFRGFNCSNIVVLN